MVSLISRSVRRGGDNHAVQRNSERAETEHGDLHLEWERYSLVNALGVKDMAAVGIVSETKQIVPLVPDTTLPGLLSL